MAIGDPREGSGGKRRPVFQRLFKNSKDSVEGARAWPSKTRENEGARGETLNWRECTRGRQGGPCSTGVPQVFPHRAIFESHDAVSKNREP